MVSVFERTIEMIDAELGTARAKDWYQDWLWKGEEDEVDHWSKTKEEIRYDGLDMAAAYHAGYQAIKKNQLTNIDLRHKIEQLELLIGANFQVMKLEIKKELEEETNKGKEQVREEDPRTT